MSDTAENCFNALVALSRNPKLESQRDALVETMSYQDVKLVLKRFLSLNLGHTTSAVPVAGSPPSPSKSAAQSSTSVPRVLGDGPSRDNSGTKTRANPPEDGRRRARKCPRVIVSVRKPSRLLSAAAARRLRPSAKTVSQALLVDGGSSSTSDTDGESVNTNEADMTDELAMDELIVDHVRPTLPQTITKPNKSEEIDWVFWVPQDNEDSRWKALSDFPQQSRARIVSKFNTDYLTKPTHAESYARMLRNREKRLNDNKCVGNVTYTNRNTLCTWKNPDAGMGNTCDTCFNRGRFCAMIVSTASGIRLGFYPLPQPARVGSTWSDLRYWFQDPPKKMKKSK